MPTNDRFRGVLAPVLTPLTPDLAPDEARLVAHAQRLVKAGLSLAPLGTTSEANSLSLQHRESVLQALVDGGIDPARIMAGTGSCALADAIRLTRTALNLGCGGVLLLPPFYYKAVTDEGLFAWFSSLIEQVGDSRLRVYLYHIPPVAQVGLSPDLIERLIVSYPRTIAGIKDSSGDWQNTVAYHDRDWEHFDVFAGSEKFMVDNLRAGGAGCISATANLNPSGLQRLLHRWDTAEGEALNDRALRLRAVFETHPMIPALKAAVAEALDDEAWALTCPPLQPLAADARESLVAELAALDFDPGFQACAAS